jgi:hypothetical protein
MKRSAIWAAGVVLILLVVGAGVLASGAGYAEDNGDNGDENAAGAQCSKATLHGTYLFAVDGVVTGGPDKGPFAVAGYNVFDGNGKINSVVSVNSNGHVIRKVHDSGTYTVKADCTGTLTFEGTDASRLDLFVAPDGSKFTQVGTSPSEVVASGFELRVMAKRVGD